MESGVTVKLLCLLAILKCCISLTIPEVTIQALLPKGIRVSVPDVKYAEGFAFYGDLYRGGMDKAIRKINGHVVQLNDGRWLFEDGDVDLVVGDVIKYWVVMYDYQSQYIKMDLSFTVTRLEQRCGKTATTVRRKPACAGYVIFQDNFDKLSNDLWEVEQRIPVNHPEFPFVSYQRLPDVIDVRNGSLRIAPSLLQIIPPFNQESIRSGTLDLFHGCTESAESCYQKATGSEILPPVVSGRINTKNTFTFRYGVVEVRAKLPEGDWIYPEILLEPWLSKYGSRHFASGVMKMAFSRGNQDLRVGLNHTGNKVLYAGVIMDHSECHDLLLMSKENKDRDWSKNFHTYTVRWEPENITMFVDGEEWLRLEGGAEGLRSRLQGCVEATQHLWKLGTNMAPFDEEFYLTLGVAVGGVTEFPDDSVGTLGRSKPWNNLSNKAKLHFWQALETWFGTWGPDSELLVDSIKVTAL